MLLRSHEARELGAYLLSRAVPLLSFLESAITLVNVPVTPHVQHRLHDTRRYLGNAVPFSNIRLLLTFVLRYRRGCGSGK